MSGCWHPSCEQCRGVVHRACVPRLNLRRSTRVGAWNVMFLSEVRTDKRTGQRDSHLPQLSAELRRLGVSVRHSQKSGDLGAVGSVGVGTTTGPAVLRGILKVWLWPSPTDWSL